MTMFLLRVLLGVILIAATAETAQALIVLPSDVGVTLTASPTTNLQPGQPIDMTLTVTNYGPADVPILFVASSVYMDEMYFVSINPDECTNMIIDVGEPTDSGYEFSAEWDLAGLGGTLPPFPPGIAVCHFQIALTRSAPLIYQFSFGLSPSLETDPNPTNDVATVTLQRAPPPPPTPLPTLSTWVLLLLAGLSAGLAANALKRPRRSAS
jgi:hypothetical protein